MSEYPEHNKLDKVKQQSQAAGEFVEWLTDVKKYVIATHINIDGVGDRLSQVHINITSLLAEFYGVDLNALEQEKQQMLKLIRQRS